MTQPSLKIWPEAIQNSIPSLPITLNFRMTVCAQNANGTRNIGQKEFLSPTLLKFSESQKRNRVKKEIHILVHILLENSLGDKVQKIVEDGTEKIKMPPSKKRFEMDPLLIEPPNPESINDNVRPQSTSKVDEEIIILPNKTFL